MSSHFFFYMLHMNCHNSAAVFFNCFSFLNCTSWQKHKDVKNTHPNQRLLACISALCPKSHRCLQVTPLPGGRSRIFISTHLREPLFLSPFLLHPCAASLPPPSLREQEGSFKLKGDLMFITLFHQLVKMSICIVCKCCGRSQSLSPIPFCLSPVTMVTP